MFLTEIFQRQTKISAPRQKVQSEICINNFPAPNQNFKRKFQQEKYINISDGNFRLPLAPNFVFFALAKTNKIRG